MHVEKLICLCMKDYVKKIMYLSGLRTYGLIQASSHWASTNSRLLHLSLHCVSHRAKLAKAISDQGHQWDGPAATENTESPYSKLGGSRMGAYP